MSQCDRVLAVLADGRAHHIAEIHQRAGTMRLNSRIAELRTRGHDIGCIRQWNRQARGWDYFYRLKGSLSERSDSPPSPLPRNRAHRSGRSLSEPPNGQGTEVLSSMRVSEKEAERHGGSLNPSGPEPQVVSGDVHPLSRLGAEGAHPQAASGPEQLAFITERQTPAWA